MSAAAHPSWVSARLCVLVAPRLRTRPGPALLGSVVRAGLLLDLAFAGRLVDGPDRVTIDTTPTGFRPADLLLAAVERRPERSVQWWLQRGAVGLDDVAGELIAEGALHRTLLRRRYVAVAVSGTVDPAAIRAAIADPAGEVEPATAAVALLTLLLPTGGEEVTATARALAGRCGPAAWIATDLADTLLVDRTRLDAVSPTPDWYEALGLLIP